ncbi:helix-turn-helix domain-containing protein [Bacillus sp. JJ722]|uniref:LexA family protein n=1 Tax=Bacillus sp. JJ722 TaxID=3122973 RepID=UPI002FFFD490
MQFKLTKRNEMTPLKPLGKRQQEILGFIEEYTNHHGFPPTVREIADGTGLASSSTVQEHLRKLTNKGFLRRDPNKPRAIELLMGEERKLVVSDLTNDDRNKLFMELVKRGFSVKIK